MTAPRSSPLPAQPGGGSAPPKRLAAQVGEKLSFVDAIFLAIENPVLRRELLTGLRSNKAFVLHFIFLLVLAAVVYLAWPTGEVSTDAQKTREVFRIFARGQLVLLAVLAPAFSAAALTLEKEQRTMDLLLTSPIRPHTILIGKFLNSVLYLFLLVLSTAPIVAMHMWLPGIAMGEVFGLYTLLLCLAAGLGMLGLTCSTFFHRTQISLSVTYLIVLPLALLLLVLSRVFDAFFSFSAALWPSGLLLIGTLIMYQSCLKRMRRPFDPVFKAAEEEDFSDQTGLVIIRERFPDILLAPRRDGNPMPDGVNPVYEKEIRCEIFGRGTLFLRLIIQISMFLSIIFLVFLYLKHEYVFMDFLMVFTMLVAPAFACSTFSQERERGTLDMLMTTLVRPGQVVWGKFLSCMRLSVFMTGLVGVTMLFFIMVGVGPPGMRLLWFGLYTLLLFTTICFETALGMTCSLLCRSTMQSMITTYGIVLVIFGAPVAMRAILLLTMTEEQMTAAAIDWYCVTSPFQAVHSVTPHLSGGALQYVSAPVWPAYLALISGLTVLFLLYVSRAFEGWSRAGARSVSERT